MNPCNYLPARLSAPKFNKSIIRDRLHQQLDRECNFQGHWIFGPAGSGKTTLVGTYLQTRDIPFIWFQIDITDNDLAYFFQNMGLAASKIVSRDKLDQLDVNPPSSDISTFSRWYFDQLFLAIQEPIVLVFDDVHAVGTDSALLTVLQSAFEAAPRHIHIFFTSRFEPDKLFTQFYINSQLAVMGWRNLCFTREETETLILSVGNDNTHKDSVDLIHEKTAGWAAGIRILARRSELDIMDIRSLQDRVPSSVFDYFASELFDHTSDDVQNFLLTSSILPPFSAVIAKAVTGYVNSDAIITEMVQTNAFIYEKVSGDIYEYHPLFREFLLNTAQKKLTPENLAQLRCRAGKIYEDNEQYNHALDLYQAAGDWHNARRMLLACAESWICQKRYKALDRLLSLMPEEITDNDPWLLMIKAIVRIDSTPAESMKIFTQCYDMFLEQSDEKGKMQAFIGNLETSLLAHQPATLIDRWLKSPQLEEHSIRTLTQPDSADAKILWLMLINLALHHLDHPCLQTLEEQARKMLQENIGDVEKLYICSALILLNCMKGDLKAAKKFIHLSDSIIPLTDAHELLSKSLNESRIFFYFLNGSFDNLEEIIDIQVDQAGSSDARTIIFPKRFYLCAAALTHHDAQTLLKHQTERTNNSDDIEYANDGYTLIVQGWTAYLKGQYQAADCYAHQAFESMKKHGSTYMVTTAHILRAIVDLAKNEMQQAQKHLDQALLLAKQIKAVQLEFQCYLIQAEILLKTGDETNTLDFIRQAFTIGNRQGYFNIWFWRPKQLALLCAKSIEADTETEYANALIKKRNLPAVQQYLNLEGWPWPIKIYTLNDFSLFLNGKPFKITNKTRKTPLYLLKVLIALGGRGVAASELRDILWPDADGDVAFNRYKITLHRLQKIIGRKDAIVTSQGQLSLNPLICWVDIWQVEQLLRKAILLWKNFDESKEELRPAIETTLKLLDTMHGPFMPDIPELWAMQRREKIKQDFIFCLIKLCSISESSADWPAAIKYYQRGLEVFPDIEYFYQRLIHCYHAQGNSSEALLTYDRCKKNLSLHYCIKPSPETEELISAIRC